MKMETRYRPRLVEKKIYAFWEKGGYFIPRVDPQKKPFTILLPPPNANDPLHMGHALYVIEDILCRWHRMKGEPTLFLPGTDHAGIETQYVFEKTLSKKGQSRFDFDRRTLYRLIDAYVEKNRGIAKEQMKRLGFSLDWTREKYTLDPQILKTVFKTFKQLHEDGLIYRGERISNYCPHCGTAFSELETNYREQKDFLYYLDYGPVSIATTRPETIFADVAVAVHPKDDRYRKLVGGKAVLPLLNKKLPIITDELVDQRFGTGALKVTPGHDAVDFEIGRRHRLETIKIIDIGGEMINVPEMYLGLTVEKARRLVAADLEKSGRLLRKEPISHAVAVCYRCQNLIEPLALPQWYVRTKPLAQPAIEAVEAGRLKIVPRRFEKLYRRWLEGIKDWNISRQIVWGPRIPVWYCLDCTPEIELNFINKKGEKVAGGFGELREKYSLGEIKKGLQSLTAPRSAVYSLADGPCRRCGGKNILQETDTFDTWFSSGQWPLTTLGYPDSPDFRYFYPTAVLDTMWDILFFWVARMVMLGLYRTGKVPFKVAHMHSRVVDGRGKKMSKSRGNVVNPMEMVEKYGADALRLALVIGVAPGSDISVSDDKIRSMRNFANKIWNMGRFVLLNFEGKKAVPFYEKRMRGLTADDRRIVSELESLIERTNKNLESFRFGQAAADLYGFAWHRFADWYLEAVKPRLKTDDRVALAVLRHVYLNILKLLHPFMPFVTEEIWGTMPRRHKDPLIVSGYPE